MIDGCVSVNADERFEKVKSEILLKVADIRTCFPKRVDSKEEEAYIKYLLEKEISRIEKGLNNRFDNIEKILKIKHI